MQIPNLASFILSELPHNSNSSQAPADDQAEVEVEWLFPQELEAIRHLDQGGRDWAEGIRMLKKKANSINFDGGDGIQMGKAMSVVPLGLKNRWRIWKILENVVGG